ncbi:GTP cyclohydrolase I FolE [Streptomyces pluripotens]|uniref:GTP cyclohydrolase 1 n=1 Tax=Streptomyces pluripotens TaxID=1355015 RepID=A0A221P7R6_9ACTN|nr:MULTISPECIES: GTP cyclohydrolase I [Streptomyces]ARP73801.1 GTP cyclohydrolase I FolE [Streptomyces pluripotens]ASN28048.1 GTP cyclohydrolase I FolE [Streptomyces pluripotens]KIE27948.1 GTP cyclohydrolase [Streptomyces sp. MUSC 125]MCH0559390.1 GTP cyclohydrolase I [Streptomyces sp. MUM 16J]
MSVTTWVQEGDVDSEEPREEDPLVGLARQLLKEIGENPDRDGLRDTPTRFARWWREFINYEPGSVGTLFESVDTKQLVIVSDIQVWSLCEHHLLPFNCSVTIAYRPTDRLLGLSKFARIAHRHAHKLQVQERLVSEIAEDIAQLSGAEDVAVIARGEHLCMTMRGIKAAAQMTSTAYRGAFGEDAALRAEMFNLLRP